MHGLGCWLYPLCWVVPRDRANQARTDGGNIKRSQKSSRVPMKNYGITTLIYLSFFLNQTPKEMMPIVPSRDLSDTFLYALFASIERPTDRY